MKDFLPNFTFGFVMAQLFPGAVTVLCLTCPYVVLTDTTLPASLSTAPMLTTLFMRVGNVWFSSTKGAIVFLFLSAATGMFIHGLDWMILGWITQPKDKAGRPIDGDTVESPGLLDLPFHQHALWKQILLGPINMAVETGGLLRASAVKWITVKENVPSINPASMPIFNWLQEFYLYFAQFYLHMAYSLVIGIFSLAFTFYTLGFTRFGVGLLLLLYLLVGLLYLMGRTQLSSLYLNEGELVASPKTTPVPLEIVVPNVFIEGRKLKGQVVCLPTVYLLVAAKARPRILRR